MGGFKLGVSLDRAPRMLQTIVLETLAGIEDLELVHIPAGEYAPDCRAVILIDDERPEAHLRARVECVINLDPETAEGWLYRVGEEARRIDQVSIGMLLTQIIDEGERKRLQSKAAAWNPFSWFRFGAEPPDEELQRLPPPEKRPPIAVPADATTAELARLAARIAGATMPDQTATGPARELRELLESLAAVAESGGERLEPLDRVAHLFALSSDERDLLFLASVVEIEPLAARLVALANDHLSRPRPTAGFVAQWGGDPRTLIERLMTDGPLVRYGLISLEGEGPISTRTVTVPAEVWPLIFGKERALPFDIERHQPDDEAEKSLISPDDWKESLAKAVATIRKAPQSEVLVAITGEEDSGRAEIARAVAARLGPASLWIDGARLQDRGVLAAVLREAAIEEATVVLSDPQRIPLPQWRALNEGLSAPLVLITTTHGLSGLSLHAGRAMVQIEAPERDHRQRIRLWTAEAPEDWAPEDIAAIADRFDFGRRRIGAALSNARVQAAAEGRQAIGPEDAMRACRALRETSFDGNAELLERPFERDDIVLRPETRRELDLAIAWARHGSRLFGKGGPAEQLHAGGGFACLFTGPPGTGKTMAAQIVAREVDYELYRVDLSQVIDKYIGEGEKRISALFEEAGRSRVALFFDEADALFGKRTEIKDSHDRYANVAVNHLLQELESFDGLSILATNFAGSIDPAVKRRVRVLAEFSAPSADERSQIWERLLTPAAIEGSDIDVRRLAEGYDMVGGEIRNAIYTAHLIAAEDKTATRLEMRHCVAGLAREIGKTGRVLDGALLIDKVAAA